jgi:hypothetical protein
MDEHMSLGARKAVWAYAYLIDPPQPEVRLRALKVLLDREQADATSRARTWASRLVAEEHVTHILVLSDSPLQDLKINRLVEAELHDLEAAFSTTTSVVVLEDETVG